MKNLNYFKFSNCCYSTKLLEKIKLLNLQQPVTSQVDIKQIIKAIYYAKKYHGNQKRDSGEPYYSHPIKVACMVADYCFTTEIIVISILHDVLEDTGMTKDMISKIFNPIIADKVMDLTRIKPTHKLTSAVLLEQLYIENKKDLLIIKLFDRLHNLLTISCKPKEKIKQSVQETLQNFLLVAALCELKDVESMLSKLCFSIQVQLNLLEEDLDLYDHFSYDHFQLPYLDRKNNILQMRSRLVLEI